MGQDNPAVDINHLANSEGLSSLFGSAGGGGGGSVLGINLPSLADIANGLVNAQTLGVAGYNGSTGRIDPLRGVATHGADEALGEVSGRNLQREINSRNEARVAAEDQARQHELDLEMQQREAQDRSASYRAGAAQSSASARTRLNYSDGIGEANKDFLGL